MRLRASSTGDARARVGAVAAAEARLRGLVARAAAAAQPRRGGLRRVPRSRARHILLAASLNTFGTLVC